MDRLRMRAYIFFMPATVLALVQFAAVVRHGSPIPMMDEWDAFPGRGLAAIFKPHNEHYIVLTKLMAELGYLVNAWDIRFQLAASYGVFLLLLLCYARLFLVVDVSQSSLWSTALSFCFLASAKLADNHGWSFQSQFHFGLGFFLLCVIQLRRCSPWALVSALLAIFSFTSGMIAILIYSLWVFWQEPDKRLRRKAYFAGVGVGIVFWFWSNAGVGHHGAPAMPFEAHFWTFFLQLLGNGFGHRAQPVVAGVLVAVSAACLFGLTIRKGSHVELVGIGLALIGVLAAVAMGRAGFDPSLAMSDRYAEVTILLLPLLVCLVMERLAYRRRSVRVAVALLLLVTLQQGFKHKFRYEKIYSGKARARGVGEECLHASLAQGGPVYCPTLYPANLDGRLAEAKRLDLHFIRQLQRD